MRRFLYCAVVFPLFFTSLTFAATPTDLWFSRDAIWTYQHPNWGLITVKLGDVVKIDSGVFVDEEYRTLLESQPFFSLFYTNNIPKGPFGAFRASVDEKNGWELIIGPGKEANEKYRNVLEDSLIKLGYDPNEGWSYTPEWWILRSPIAVGTDWRMASIKVKGEDKNGREFWISAELYGKIVRKEKIANYPEAYVVEYSVKTSAANGDSKTELYQTWWLAPGVGPVKIQDFTGFTVTLKDFSITQKQPVDPGSDKTSITWGAIKRTR